MTRQPAPAGDVATAVGAAEAFLAARDKRVGLESAARAVIARAWSGPRDRDYLDLTENDLRALLREASQLRAELADVAGYLAAIHRHAARHDVLAANLGCAGCELLAQIESGAEP